MREYPVQAKGRISLPSVRYCLAKRIFLPIRFGIKRKIFSGGAELAALEGFRTVVSRPLGMTVPLGRLLALVLIAALLLGLLSWTGADAWQWWGAENGQGSVSELGLRGLKMLSSRSKRPQLRLETALNMAEAVTVLLESKMPPLVASRLPVCADGAIASGLRG